MSNMNEIIKLLDILNYRELVFYNPENEEHVLKYNNICMNYCFDTSFKMEFKKNFKIEGSLMSLKPYFELKAFMNNPDNPLIYHSLIPQICNKIHFRNTGLNGDYNRSNNHTIQYYDKKYIILPLIHKGYVYFFEVKTKHILNHWKEFFNSPDYKNNI